LAATIAAWPTMTSSSSKSMIESSIAVAMLRHFLVMTSASSTRLRTPSTIRSRHGKSSAGWSTSPSAERRASRAESSSSLAVRSARWLIAIGLMATFCPDERP
jgi:hypothetical protein